MWCRKYAFNNTSEVSYSKTTGFNMVWRPCVAESILFITPARGLIQQQQVLMWSGAHVLPIVYIFYNTSAGSYSKATGSNVVWRTCVAERILFLTPARCLIQKQRVLIWFGEHVLPTVYFS